MGGRMVTSLLNITESEVNGRFASSKTFQREYVIAKRKEFIDTGNNFEERGDSDEVTLMETWKQEAKVIFFHEGDYKVYPDGKVEWLGEY